jgi:hypothetical protein
MKSYFTLTLTREQSDVLFYQSQLTTPRRAPGHGDYMMHPILGGIWWPQDYKISSTEEAVCSHLPLDPAEIDACMVAWELGVLRGKRE